MLIIDGSSVLLNSLLLLICDFGLACIDFCVFSFSLIVSSSKMGVAQKIPDTEDGTLEIGMGMCLICLSELFIFYDDPIRYRRVYNARYYA